MSQPRRNDSCLSHQSRRPIERPEAANREVAGPDSDVADLSAASDAPIASELLAADHQLAQRCVAGEVKAWEELYGQYHSYLVGTIRILLNGRSHDGNLAEEIASQVWCALVDNDGALLLRYDPARGARLATFMRAIARDILCRHFRSERRRFDRETVASSARPEHYAAQLDQVDVSLDEFLDTLTPGERQFCDDYLLAPSLVGGGSTASLTRANFWQKTHRVYSKFVQFFRHDT